LKCFTIGNASIRFLAINRLSNMNWLADFRI